MRCLREGPDVDAYAIRRLAPALTVHMIYPCFAPAFSSFERNRLVAYTYTRYTTQRYNPLLLIYKPTNMKLGNARDF